LKQLIVNADDLGLTSGVNRGILQAFQDGIVTSASLLVTGHAFDEAVALARQNPKLDVGLHLALVEERASLGRDALPTLVDETGRFPRTSAEFIRRAVLRRIKTQDCDFPILIATNISTCSRLFSKSLGGLPAGWIMFGFAILLAPGENRRMSEWDGGYGCLV
jgi:hypothetical protein